MKARGWFNCAAALVLLALLIGLPSAGSAKADGPCGPTVVQKGKLILVSPGGGDDTAAIQCALDLAIASGPGAVVQLREGTFHTSFITAYGFNGVFKGAGKGKTVIEALPDLRCDLKYAEGKYPGLIEFHTARALISGLTLRFPDETPCILPESGNPFYQGNSLGTAIWINANFTNSCDVNEISRADVVIDSIAIEAVPGELGDPSYFSTNLVHGVIHGSSFNKGIPDCPEIGARTTGVITVTRSNTDHVGLPVFVSDLKNGKVVIGGSPATANTFTNLGNIVMRSNFNTLGVISYNRFDNAFWSSVTMMVDAPSDWFLEPVDQPSTYVMDHNVLNVAGNGNGAWLEDQNLFAGLPAAMRASITSNEFNLDGEWVWGVGGWAAENVLVARNKFGGASHAGVWLGVAGYEGDPLISASKWLLKDNNMAQLTPSVAHYFLTNTSANNLVIGTGAETAIDQGSGNILKNVVVQPALAESMAAPQEAEAQPAAPAFPKGWIDTRWH